MYAITTAIIIITGTILTIFAKKLGKNNKTRKICIRTAGIILILTGLLLLYFVVYGVMLLPMY